MNGSARKQENDDHSEGDNSLSERVAAWNAAQLFEEKVMSNAGVIVRKDEHVLDKSETSVLTKTAARSRRDGVIEDTRTHSAPDDSTAFQRDNLAFELSAANGALCEENKSVREAKPTRLVRNVRNNQEPNQPGAVHVPGLRHASQSTLSSRDDWSREYGSSSMDVGRSESQNVLNDPLSAVLVDEAAERDRDLELQRLREEISAQRSNAVTAVVIPEEPHRNEDSCIGQDEALNLSFTKMVKTCTIGLVLVVVIGVVVAEVVEDDSSTSGAASTLTPPSDETPPSLESGPCFKSKQELIEALNEYQLDSSSDTELASIRGWPVSEWCVSELEDFSYLLENNADWNYPIQGWNVAKAINMAYMFSGATAFNQDLSTWNLSRVQNMQGMFLSAESFNGDISTWDVSKVQTMAQMFEGASNFQVDISAWDVSNVLNMRKMFRKARKFNGDLNLWDVSNVRDMTALFSHTDNFNGDVSDWDTSKVVSMTDMFYMSSAFNGNISHWNVSSVLEMEKMFFDSNVFNQSISSWQVLKVKTLEKMFHGARSFNQDLSSWDISNCHRFEAMFESAISFNQSLCAWGDKMPKIVTLEGMFRGTACVRTDDPVVKSNGVSPLCTPC